MRHIVGLLQLPRNKVYELLSLIDVFFTSGCHSFVLTPFQFFLLLIVASASIKQFQSAHYLAVHELASFVLKMHTATIRARKTVFSVSSGETRILVT
jgi:hypothetical protein